MAFSLIKRGFLNPQIKNIDIKCISTIGINLDFRNQKIQNCSASSNNLYQNVGQMKNLNKWNNIYLTKNSREYSNKSSKKHKNEEYDSDSDSDEERKLVVKRDAKGKYIERGNTDFWRLKMRTLHKILDLNHDGVISFDDFKLLGKQFTDLGHLKPATSKEFFEVLKESWEEQWGEITPYNLVTAEQFLADMHHVINDKDLIKKVGKFLPYLFKAVDVDHSGYLDLDQYKLFFRCLGLSDEDAAISFAIIDKNADNKLTLKEFVKLGREYFLTENEKRVSRMFWGPLVIH